MKQGRLIYQEVVLCVNLCEIMKGTCKLLIYTLNNDASALIDVIQPIGNLAGAALR